MQRADCGLRGARRFRPVSEPIDDRGPQPPRDVLDEPCVAVLGLVRMWTSRHAEPQKPRASRDPRSAHPMVF